MSKKYLVTGGTGFIGSAIIKKLLLNKNNKIICFDSNIRGNLRKLGNNLKKSPRCYKYLYYFHALASTHVIYKSNAFDNFDIIFTNGEYQIQEIRENEKIFNLKRKELYNSGYFYLRKTALLVLFFLAYI